MSRVFLSALERGMHAPNVLVLRRLAEALQVPLAVLVDEAGNPSPMRLDRPHVVSLRPVQVPPLHLVRPE
jgi:transcriptional regulator with XRE-family HTH domain